MAGLIPQSFIDDLLNRTDIVDVVSSRSRQEPHCLLPIPQGKDSVVQRQPR